MVKFDCLEKRLIRIFNRYGRLLSRHPVPFIVIPLLVSFALSFGFMYLERYTDVEYLFTNQDSNVRRSIEMVEATFPSENTTDHFLRITVMPNMIVEESGDSNTVTDNSSIDSKSKNNVWTSEVMEEIIKLDSKIRNTVVKDQDTGLNLNWTSVCYLQDGSCPPQPVLQLIQYNSSIVGTFPLNYPVHEISLGPYAENLRLYLPAFFGGVTHKNDTIQSAQAFRLIYITRNDRKEALVWENKVRDEVILAADPKEYKYITFTVFSTTSLDDEITNLTGEGLPLMSVLFSTMFIFAVLVSMSADWTVSKPWLAFGGLISASLAIVSAFGLLLFFLPFVDMITSVPFLALGIGLDDMFVMMASWRKTSGAGSTVEERMCAAMSDAAVSITITTLTDLLAIGVGAVSDIPSVRYFCIFAATTVFIDYIYQITFFAGCMVLSGRREMAQRHALTFRKILPKSELSDRDCCYVLCCGGGTSELHPDSPADKQELWAMTFFRDTFGRAIMSIPGKIFVCVLYAAYIGVGIWGCTNLRQGLELTRIVLDDSYVNTDIRMWDKYYREYDDAAFVVVYDDLDYCSEKDRNRISDAIGIFEAHDLFHGAEVSEVWTRDFDLFIAAQNISIDSKGTFWMVMNNMFLIQPRYQKHRQNIKIDFSQDPEGKITASRFLIYAKNLTTPEIKIRMEKEGYEITQSSGLNMTLTQEFLIFYESWGIVLPATLQNFGIAAATVLFVCMLLIPSPICSVYVALSIGSMAVGLVGCMTFWDVNLDSISMIQVIMAVGFSVDFTAHIVYSFCVAPGSSKNDRVREALYGLGVPIVQGALSTIVAILVLASSTAYIFRVFFITLFLTMVFGAAHGLLFVPVVLSLIGPAPIETNPDQMEPTDDKVGTELSNGISNGNLDAMNGHASVYVDKQPSQTSMYDNITPVFWPPLAKNQNNHSSNGNIAGNHIVLNSNGISKPWTQVPVTGSPEIQLKKDKNKEQTAPQGNYSTNNTRSLQKQISLTEKSLQNYKRGSVTSVGDISNSVALQDEVQWSWSDEDSKERWDKSPETKL